MDAMRFRPLCTGQRSENTIPRLESGNAKEAVRQWILRELVQSYNYPAPWIGRRIVPIEPKAVATGAMTSTGPLFGLCLLTQDRDPFAFVAVAVPGEAAEAERELRLALSSSSTARLGMVTDGTAAGTRFLRYRNGRDQCEYVADLEVYSQPELASGGRFYVAESDQNPGGDVRGRPLLPLAEGLESVLFEAHSHIRDIDGMHADEALDEICKLLYAKLYDEESTPSNQPYRLQRWLYGSIEECAATARAVYGEAVEQEFRGRPTHGGRSRDVLRSPLRLSSPAVVRVLETLQGYDLTHSAADIKGRAFQRMLAPAVRAGMGQYFTPDAIVRFMVSVSGVTTRDLVLDPFCGSGHFLATCLERIRRQGDITDGDLHQFSSSNLHGIEKSERMVRVAVTGMQLYGDGCSGIRHADALVSFSNHPDLRPTSFDLILTNPPFGSILSAEAVAQLGDFQLGEKGKRMPLEVLGLERCMQFLRPGGRLGIVLPDGILANRASVYVRAWLEKVAKIRAIISLPIETFAPFGANIKTSVLFVRKWNSDEEKRHDYSVFLGRIDNVGYDAAGRAREGEELGNMAREASLFLEREGW